MNLNKLTFMIIMMMSTVMTLSSSSWLGMWMGLEMNLMSFIPLMYNQNNLKSSQAMMIYFLTQSISSMIMLFSMISIMMMSSTLIKEMAKISIMISIMIKIGMPPFHSWMPEVMGALAWMPIFMLSTWQKMGPLFILSTVISSPTIYLFIISGSLISAIGGINVTSTRKIMAYSSMSHLSWMSMLMTTSMNWYKYMMMYSMMMSMMCYNFHNYNFYFMNQINSKIPIMGKMSMSIMLLSLGGMPPMLGFLPKWMVIQTMLYNNMYLLMMFMLLMSLITLFYYMRLISSLMLSFSSTSKMINTKNNYTTLTMMINLMLPLFSVMNII
uniref:NADH dehydrogenase subunit 2 n=1 Tax=Pylorgus porrectus TaxID=3051108 RepID=UPI0025A98F53|nr:NADH dehydrogenase subunit 2 [Pylorgus porrectus]WIF28473.1 NADH dehydrogenase subunit 2 [Pylorgus porrectus]